MTRGVIIVVVVAMFAECVSQGPAVHRDLVKAAPLTRERSGWNLNYLFTSWQ